MTSLPLDARSRAELRVAHRRRILAQAEKDAAAYSLSAKCHGYGIDHPRHAGREDGCRNGGTTCLCACHDQTIKEKP